ncbi:MAG: hypothetical protein GXP24_09310 [Planctomycetes bacterium]|nr:hypothetical protein [Planctomycetota bacterium]
MLISVGLLAFLLGPLAAHGPIAAHAQLATRRPENPLYESVADEVYLQESPEKIATTAPVTALAVEGDTIYAVVAGKLHRLVGSELREMAGAPTAIQRLCVVGGHFFITTDKAVFLLDNGKATLVFDQPMVDFCLHLRVVHGATTTDIYRFVQGQFVNIKPKTGWLTTNTTMIMADGSQVLATPVEISPVRRITSYNDTLYVLRQQGLGLIEGDVFNKDHVEWGMPPSPNFRDMLTLGSRIFMSTDRGLAVLSGAALDQLTGKEGLPYENMTCLTQGFGGDLWIGTTTGAIRKVGDDYHYFGAHHWLPGDHVHDIVVQGDVAQGNVVQGNNEDDEKRVYIATDKGLGIIHYQPYTLRKKAAYFEQNVKEWGHLRLGFAHKLYRNAEGEWLREISDNDGGHTAHYLAAMCFKYAVTQDETDRQEAVNSFEAMRWLQTITETDGFFARSIWAVGADQGKIADQGSGGLPAKWYTTEDGKWKWKGDTSSDEVNSHYYAVGLFHDLVANDAEKEKAADHLGRIAKHIIDNGWVLRDMDGQPTRWGRWDPEYLLQPYGYASRGLNGMEAQSYLWTALALTGKPIYRDGLDQLFQLKYHTFTVREKLTFPPEDVVPWDDELAFRALHPLLTYCDDPYLRGIYLRALQRHWEVLRIQKVPFFNYMYGGLTGNDCEAAVSAQHLREWSLDTVSHSYHNSHRTNLGVEPGYTAYTWGTRAMSPREQDSMWESRFALNYDGGSNGNNVTPPVGWIEDYWMGRYYGMIEAPATQEKSLLTVTPSRGEPQGAKPYAGSPRP